MKHILLKVNANQKFAGVAISTKAFEMQPFRARKCGGLISAVCFFKEVECLFAATSHSVTTVGSRRCVSTPVD